MHVFKNTLNNKQAVKLRNVFPSFTLSQSWQSFLLNEKSIAAVMGFRSRAVSAKHMYCVTIDQAMHKLTRQTVQMTRFLRLRF